MRTPPVPTAADVAQSRLPPAGMWAAEISRSRRSTPEQCWNLCEVQANDAIKACLAPADARGESRSPVNTKSCLDGAQQQLKSCNAACPSLNRGEVRP